MRKLISLILITVLVLLAGAAALACAPESAPQQIPEPAPQKTLDIGVAAAISGRAAYMGNQMQNCILLAIDKKNKAGGVSIAGEKYKLNPIVRDTKFDPTVSKTVSEELIYDKKVKVIVGPFVMDVVGVQAVSEPQKVILLAAVPMAPTVSGPNKPYTFFFANPEDKSVDGLYSYVHEFYKDAKTVSCIMPDSPDSPLFVNAAKGSCQRYGFQYLGMEKYAVDTKDFMPTISRLLDKKPDVVDTTATGSSMGGLVALLVKQLREAGYNGIIMIPTVPPQGLMEEQVPAQYLAKVVSGELATDSPIISKTYWDFFHLYEKTYGETPSPLASNCYDVISSFLDFLDGRSTMDTTVWMEEYAKYHWQDLYDRDCFWAGKPQLGINRRVLHSTFVSEFIDGKLETKWEAPMLLDVFVEK